MCKEELQGKPAVPRDGELFCKDCFKKLPVRRASASAGGEAGPGPGSPRAGAGRRGSASARNRDSLLLE